jgi:hypothetical protein
MALPNMYKEIKVKDARASGATKKSPLISSLDYMSKSCVHSLFILVFTICGEPICLTMD